MACFQRGNNSYTWESDLQLTDYVVMVNIAGLFFAVFLLRFKVRMACYRHMRIEVLCDTHWGSHETFQEQFSP